MSEKQAENAGVMNTLYVALALILMAPISAYNRDEVELLTHGNNECGYLLSEGIPGLDPWEQDLDSKFPIDMDEFCDILLEICLDLGLANEDVSEIFPDVCGQEYEFCPFWEDEWMIGDSCW